jgi:hypothetical protein
LGYPPPHTQTSTQEPTPTQQTPPPPLARQRQGGGWRQKVAPPSPRPTCPHAHTVLASSSSSSASPPSFTTTFAGMVTSTPTAPEGPKTTQACVGTGKGMGVGGMCASNTGRTAEYKNSCRNSMLTLPIPDRPLLLVLLNTQCQNTPNQRVTQPESREAASHHEESSCARVTHRLPTQPHTHNHTQPHTQPHIQPLTRHTQPHTATHTRTTVVTHSTQHAHKQTEPASSRHTNPAYPSISRGMPHTRAGAFPLGPLVWALIKCSRGRGTGCAARS